MDQTMLENADREKSNLVQQLSLDRLMEPENTDNLPAVPHQGKLLTFESLMDVPVTLVFEVGRTEISIKELLDLNVGSFVELVQVSVDTIDIRVDDVVIAHGETIAIKKHYGIRFGELTEMTGKEALHEA